MQQETIKPYSPNGEKASQVEEMFDNIAPTYDVLNHRLSLSIDTHWRKKAVEAIEAVHPKTILDVATGTGDLAILMGKKYTNAKITGVDISEGMMKIAQEKYTLYKKSLPTGWIAPTTFAREDCMKLSYTDYSFDVVTSAFGIRNFQNLEQGLAEMYRVLNPEGTLCMLELTTPVSFPMKQLFSLYSHHVLPFYGNLISKDKAAYQYLTNTIEAFPQGEKMMNILRNVGFRQASFQRLTGGICTLYLAKK